MSPTSSAAAAPTSASLADPAAPRVVVSPEHLTGFVAAQSTAAGEATTLAQQQRAPAAVLAPTFGIIGADFLATLGAVLATRAHQIDTIAARHRGLGLTTAAAQSAYVTTDRELSLP